MSQLEGYLLSPQQLEAWYNTRKGHTQNVQIVFGCEEKPDGEQLKASVYKALEGSNIYKLGFRQPFGYNEPLQVPGAEHRVAFAITEVANTAEAVELAVQNRHTALDLEKGPLLNIELFRNAEGEDLIAFTSSPVCADAWSIGLLASRTMDSYAGKELAEPAIDYLQYSEWQNQLLESEDVEEGRAHWSERLSHRPGNVHLLLEKKNPSELPALSTLSFHPGAELETLLGGLETPEPVLGAAWYLLLWKLNNGTPFVLGSVNHGRSFEQLYHTLGNFSKTVPLSLNIAEGQLMTDLVQMYQNELDLADTHKEALKTDEAYRQFVSDNLAYQFEYLDHDLYEGSSRPLLNELSGGQALKIRLQVNKNGADHRISICYDRLSFDRSDIECLFHAWTSVATDIIKNRHTKTVDEADLLGGEYRQIVSGFSHASSFPEADTSVTELFRKQVLQHAGRIAVDDGEQAVTYGELDRRSTALAMYLIGDSHAGGQRRIGILHTESFGMILSMMAILKAGHTYVPIDPRDSKKRLEHILSDSHIDCVLTESGLVEMVAAYSHVRPLVLDELDLSDEASPDMALPERSPGTPAYIIYTSGTSGLPKGVVIKDASLVNYVSWLKRTFDLSSEDSSVLLSSYAFDLGYTALWGMLLSGGRLHLLRRELVQEMDFLTAYIAANGISFLKTTPSFFQVLVRSSGAGKLSGSSLRQVLLGGEVINADDLMLLHTEINPDVSVANHYGPTETTIGTVAHKIDLSQLDLYKQHPVIGSPVSNNQVFILDNNGNMTIPGMPGEICIAGKGLAAGYLNREELTQEKFREHPGLQKKLYYTGDLGCWLSNGTILYLGRKDDQVKIRGYRVEPGEVKLAVSQYPGVDQAVIMVKAADPYNKELVAYITSKDKLDMEDLRAFLKDSVPDYMIPAHLLQLEEIPLTANHKIDYKALPDPATLKSPVVRTLTPPRTPREQSILRIWKDILGREDIGIDDNFFDVGGHSLKAIQMVNRLHKELKLKSSLKDIFNHPTIRQLSDITAGSAEHEFHQIEKVPEQEYYELSHSQKRIWLTSQRRSSRNIYNVPQQCLFKGALDADFLENAFIRLIERHEALRTVFRNVQGNAVQKILSPAEVKFSLERLSFNSKEELEQMINREATEPFDIENGISLRAKLVRTGDDEHLLLFTLHHIISDGWSRTVMYKELLHFYESSYHGTEVSLPPLRIQYKDYVGWHNQVYKEQEGYWAETFRGGMPVNNFPLDYRRPKTLTFNGNVRFLRIGGEDLQKLQKAVNDHKLTMNSLFLAAYGFLLGEYCGQNQVTAGTIVSGRSHLDLEAMIGVFINYLPIRIDIDKERSFIEYGEELNNKLIAIYQNQEYPFDLMVEKFYEVTDPSRNPVFDTMLIFHSDEDSHYSKTLPGGVQIEEYREHITQNVSKLDFKADVITRSDEVVVRLEYNRNLFGEDTMQLFLDRFGRLLCEIAANPAVRLAELSPVPAEEIRLLEDKRRNQVQAKLRGLKIISSFTAEPLQDYLNWWVEEIDLPYEVSFGGYHQVLQELMSITEEEDRTCVLLNRFEDYVRPEDDRLFETLDLVFDKLVENVTRTAGSRPVIVVLLPVDEHHLSNSQAAAYIAHLNDQTYKALEPVKNVYLVDLRNGEESGPATNIFDPVSYKNAHIPFTEDFFYVLAYRITRVLWALRGTPCKVIALDCDNTLWEGICGEDSLADIKVREGHRELQQYFIRKYNEGFLLVILSKNNENDVWNVFDNHPDMLLKKEHFVSWKIDWQAKAENIRSLARELSLGLDSFAFIDDNPLECHQMMRENPQVLSLELPADHRHYGSFLGHVIAFDKLNISREDALRNEMYKAEKKRGETREGTDLDSFLQSLGLEMSIRRVKEQELERASQLSKRTNQFNLNGMRHSVQDIAALVQKQDFECYVVHVRDRFGDYGLVGMVITETRKEDLLLHSFMLSCRVLGRGVEQAVMAVVKRFCEERNIDTVSALYAETAKNIPFRDFLAGNNWKAAEAGDAVYQVRAEDIAAAPEYIALFVDGDLPLKESPAAQAEVPAEFMFDHIGIAVRNMTATASFFEELGFSWAPAVHDPLQNSRLSMGTHPEYFNVELVEGVGEDSPLTNILNAGEAVPYHICFRVKSHRKALDFLGSSGLPYEMISEPRPAILFNNLKVLFFYQKDIGLVELIEDPGMNALKSFGSGRLPILQVLGHDLESTIRFYQLFGFAAAGARFAGTRLLHSEHSGSIEVLTPSSEGLPEGFEAKGRTGAYRLVLNNQPSGSNGREVDYILYERPSAADTRPVWIWHKNLCNEENLVHDKVYKALEFCSLQNLERIRQQGVSKRVSKAVYEPAADEQEALLVSIFEEVLRMDKVGVNDDFFDLGGHSIKATQILSRIYKAWKVEIPLTTFFDRSTVRLVSEYITKQKETDQWLETSLADDDDRFDEIVL